VKQIMTLKHFTYFSVKKFTFSIRYCLGILNIFSVSGGVGGGGGGRQENRIFALS
jgi:hypothetical protein